MAGVRISFLVLLLLGGCLWLLTGQSWALLLLAVMVLYLLLALLLVYPGNAGTSLSLEALREGEKQRAGEVSLQWEHPSPWPLACCRIALSAANLLLGSRQELRLTESAGPGRSKRISLDMGDAHCGVLSLEIVDAALQDPLGLFRRTLPVAAGSAEILVSPELHPEELPLELLERYDMESFRYASGKVGSDSSETVGIREYVNGDSTRAIHWKLTAKEDRLMVKEYGLPVDSKLLLLADKRKRSTEEEMERLTELTLSLSKMLVERGIRHDLGWYDGGERRFLRHSVGTAEDLATLIPSFLRSPFLEDPRDPATRYLEDPGRQVFASYLYVSASEEAAAEGAASLREYGHVAVCTPTKE